MSGLSRDDRAGIASFLRYHQGTTHFTTSAKVREWADKLEAAQDLPVDALRLAAEHSGRLADIVRTCEHEAHADTIDLSAEYFQKTANGEPVEWDAVLEDLAARELKWRGLEGPDEPR